MMKITEKIAAKILNNALKTGADFAELFLEDKKSNSIKLVKTEVDEISKATYYGGAIRILKGVSEVNGYTNDVTEEGLMALSEKLANAFSGTPIINVTNFNDKDVIKHTDIKKFSKDIANSKKIEYLKIVTETVLARSEKVRQVIATFVDDTQDVTIINSNGVFKKDIRNHQRIGLMVVAGNEKVMQQQFNSYGGTFEFEKFKDYDLKKIAEDTTDVAVMMLDAPEMKGGIYDVIINNGFGGVIFHEACGHALEATSVSKGLSVFTGKIGEKIASDIVTAYDDGTIPYEWGSENIDDEGFQSTKNLLIENGILKGYMIDYRNSRRMGMKPTAASRRQSYRYSPTSRMTNTYIAPGKSTLEEIIANTKYGLFAKKMGGGSVNPATGEFNFAVSEGYMVEDGKITHPVRGATLIGNGKDTLLNIDMVGNNLEFGYGMCGSSSGSLPVCVGQPTIRVTQMTVGGMGGEE